MAAGDGDVGDADIGVVSSAELDVLLVGEADDVRALALVLLAAEDLERDVGRRRLGDLDGLVGLVLLLDEV